MKCLARGEDQAQMSQRARAALAVLFGSKPLKASESASTATLARVPTGEVRGALVFWPLYASTGQQSRSSERVGPAKTSTEFSSSELKKFAMLSSLFKL